MITTWSSGAPDSNMAEELLVELGEMVRQHPWWQARARLAVRLLHGIGVRPPARVMDAGCGWGVTLAALERAGYHTSGLDVSRRALVALDEPGRTLIEADLSMSVPSEAKASFDAVLALDVIEHIDDDRGVVAALGQLAKPGGHVIVSVPALPNLYSEFDRVQGHRRRYTVPTLESAFAGTGLTLARTFWWGEWMVPVLRMQRLKTSKTPPASSASPLETYRSFLRLPPWPMPLIMNGAFRWEEGRALRGGTRTGTSLFAVARR